MVRRPRVALIGMGGTISSLGRSTMDLVNYGDTGRIMHSGDILAQVPELGEVADVICIRFRNMPAIEIGPTDWLALNDKIHQVAAEQPGLDGIVVTHGTATLEETAYFLNLTLRISIPVIIVGSQRPFSAISSDAQINLINAVRTAGSVNSIGKGVLVVMNDEIHAAREVTKTDTYRLQAFRSPELGALGYADADRIVFYRSPTRAHTTSTPFDVRGRKYLPRVDMVVSYAGSDGALIVAARQAGASGIVAAGFAPGYGTPAEVKELRRAVDEGVIVVQAARAHSGRVDARDRIKAANFVAADNLSPQKATILLMLSLTVTDSLDSVQRFFWEY